jgi:hypothetical protein
MKTRFVGFLFLATAAVVTVYAAGNGPGATNPSHFVIHQDQLDAFSRVGVAQPTTLFDSAFQYDAQPLLWEQTTNATATITHLPNESSLSMTSTNGATCAIQTRQYHRYQPGKAQQVFMTGTFGADASSTERIGYFDAQNGFFFEVVDGDLYVVRRSNVTGTTADTRVERSAFNLNRSTTIDLTKPQIFVFDIQFLGVGRVRMGVDIDGLVVWLHEFRHANREGTGVYMTTANLPCRYEIKAGTGAYATLKAICTAVISSGGFEDERGFPFAAANVIDVAATTTPACAIAIRPKLTFNSITTRAHIIPRGIEVLGGGNPLYYEIRYGDTFTSANWVSADANSVVEYSTNAVVNAAGRLIDSGFVASSGGTSRSITARDIASRLPLVLDSTGSNAVPLTVIVRTTTLTANTRASVSWKELR